MKLGGEQKSQEQFTMIVEVVVATLLVIALFMIICWVVYRGIRGARICCCAVSHPMDVWTRRLGRSGEYRSQRQVKFNLFVSIDNKNHISIFSVLS